MEMPKPTPGHLRLEALAGHWEGEETMHPSQWDPKGGTAAGRTTSRVALSGFVVITDYEQERDGIITFAGHGVWSFDPGEDLYVLHWFDCLGSPAERFLGRFDGEVLTVAHGGPPMHARLTYDLTDPQLLVSKMEMSQDGVAWITLFDGRYKRT
jgi:hypothetical protein